MCNWVKTLTFLALFSIENYKCVNAFNRRGPFRMYRKGPPSLPQFPPLSISPPRTAAQNFHPEYELPPFMMPSPPSAPITSYGEPAVNYGPPTPTMKPIIHKHIYVHIPPPEPEVQTTSAPLTASPPQKHYKIVFIKAPPPPSPTVQNIPLQPPDEEKTLVYVLVKKPDDPPKLVIPTPAPTQPSKPEVYFIRYKAQKEQSNDDGPYPASVSASATESATLGPPLAAYGVPNATYNKITARNSPNSANNKQYR